MNLLRHSIKVFILCFQKIFREDWASQLALAVKNLPANAGDVKEVGSVPRSGTFLGEGFSNPL